MRNRILKNRTIWLLLGLIAGLGVARFWPSEPAYAVTSDRSSKFIMTTCTVSVIGMDPIEAVFILDTLTGSLKGAVLNRQFAKFHTYYYRDLVADFKIDGKVEPQFALVNGQGQLLGQAGINWASSVLYVAEMNSGKVICYAFPWRDAPGPLDEPVQLRIVDSFYFRRAAS